MADITVTEVNVKRIAGARPQQVNAGEAIGFGVPVCTNPADKNNLYIAGALEASDTFRTKVVGITVGKSLSADQLVSYLYTNGDVVDFGAGVLEQAMWYALSANRGKICPVTDFAKFQVNTTQITSNVATYTTTIAHPFQTGQTLTIAGCANSYYNGQMVVASTPTATTFTVSITHANQGPNSETGASALLKTAVMNLLGIARDDRYLQLYIKATALAR